MVVGIVTTLAQREKKLYQLKTTFFPDKMADFGPYDEFTTNAITHGSVKLNRNLYGFFRTNNK